jgi:hypothetical protein
VQSLAMVAEVVHGAPFRFRDPVRFSLAHGGKDRHPCPVPIRVYDETIGGMKFAVYPLWLFPDGETSRRVLSTLASKQRRMMFRSTSAAEPAGDR